MRHIYLLLFLISLSLHAKYEGEFIFPIIDGADSYIIRFYDSKNKEQPYFEKKVKVNKIKWLFKDITRSYFSYAYTKGEKLSEFSDIVPVDYYFNKEIKELRLFQPTSIKDSKKIYKTKLSWQYIPSSPIYLLEVSKDKVFRDIVSFDYTKRPEYLIELKDGAYFWRATAYSKETIHKSSAQSFTIKKKQNKRSQSKRKISSIKEIKKEVMTGYMTRKKKRFENFFNFSLSGSKARTNQISNNLFGSHFEYTLNYKKYSFTSLLDLIKSDDIIKASTTYSFELGYNIFSRKNYKIVPNIGYLGNVSSLYLDDIINSNTGYITGSVLFNYAFNRKHSISMKTKIAVTAPSDLLQLKMVYSYHKKDMPMKFNAGIENRRSTIDADEKININQLLIHFGLGYEF